jgi:carboxypeptidase T
MRFLSTLSLGICLLFFFPSFGQQSQETYMRVRIDLRGKNPQALAALGLDLDHGMHETDVALITEISLSELEQVKRAGFQVQVLIEDLQAWYLMNQQATDQRGASCADPYVKYTTPEHYTYGTMGGYQTLEEILATLDAMRSAFPQLVSQRFVISDSLLTHEGRPVWGVRLSVNPDVQENEPEVLFTALHHAREPIGMTQLLYFMWYLLENYETNDEIRYILDHEALYFVPCVNPDGYEYNRQIAPNGGGMWRKNRRNNGNNIFGVDLNRNYGYFWGNDNVGSSPDIGSGTYRGPAPFSEPESRMIRDFTLAHNFSFIEHYHSFGNLLIYPWSYSDQVADSSFVKWGRLFVQENKFKQGTAIQTVGYKVNGDSNDWAYSATGAYCYTPEVGTTFWPLFSDIDRLNKSCLLQNMTVALAPLRSGIVEDKSAEFYADLQWNLPMQLTRYGIQDGPLTVSLISNSPDVQDISGAQVFDLAVHETTGLAFNLQLKPGTVPGTPVILLVQVFNGVYTRTDTLVKYYGGSDVMLFEDNGSNTDNWNGDWGLTTEYAYSPPSSMTDSPGNLYQPFSENTWESVAPIVLPAGAKNAQLRFFTQWSIHITDYAQIQALTPDGALTPLCGRYTKPGRPWQDEGNPVYSEDQLAWVEECISLDDYLGIPIYLRWLLHSNGVDEADGIYVDDVQVVYTDPFTLQTTQVQLDQWIKWSVQPNPAHTYADLTWLVPNARVNGAFQMEVLDAAGRQVFRASLGAAAEGRYRIPTRDWPSGMYTCRLIVDKKTTTAVKIQVQH